MKGHEIVIQRRLAPEQKLLYYLFPKGMMVWPQRSGRGVLTTDLQAEKQEKMKVEGYQAWRAKTSMHLYLDGKFWQLSCGTLFGAPVKSVKKISLN